jgi:hypothetical protein
VTAAEFPTSGIVWHSLCVLLIPGTGTEIRKSNAVLRFELFVCEWARNSLRTMMEKADTIGGQWLRKILQRALAFFLAADLLCAFPASAADLRPETLKAFDRYMQLTEAEFNSETASGKAFLWVNRLPPEQQTAAYEELRQGKAVIERLETRDNGKRLEIPDGMVHHWIGTVFIPGATLAVTLALVQDYDHHQDYYHPDVQRSKILYHKDNDFLVLLRFYKKKIITTVLDTEHDVHYSVLDPKHAMSQSRTTRIQEVDDAGKPDEQLEPAGRDRGLLWRMNTYWRFEEKDGGTYVESQSISLTRDIPTGLGWMIGPYVNSVPRESLTFTLAATRTGVLQRLAAHAAA